MNRAKHFNYIEEKLSILAYRVEMRGKLNILDHHLHSENFYMHLFNLLFGWQLQNMNQVQQNVEAIDLIDYNNKVVVQVSATATRQKIESSLSKDLSVYRDFSFKFISISKGASALRGATFTNPHKLVFDPKSDIYDVGSLLKHIISLDVDDQKLICDFLKKELGEEDTHKPEPSLDRNNVLKQQLQALLAREKEKEQKETVLFGESRQETTAEIARLTAEIKKLL